MDLRQLEYFVTVARLGHFTQSAEQLYVGQPALSQAIRRLERELGVELLNRAVHPIQLTSAGSALLPYAERAVEAVMSAREEFGLIGGAPSGRVTVGAMASVGPVESVITEFARLYPNVDVVLREGITGELVGQLVNGQVDAVIATLIRPLPAGIESVIVFSEPMLLMAPKDSGLQDGVRIQDLDGCVLLMPSQGSGVRMVIETGLEKAGIHWRRGPESNDVQRQRVLVSEGVGLAIVPQSAVPVGTAPVKFFELGDNMRREVALMWARDRRHTSSIRAFLDVARRELTNSGMEPGENHH